MANKDGFSLVEIIVVLGVIALMIGAISPVIVSQYCKGQTGKAIATIETLREAVSQYIEQTSAVSLTGISVSELSNKRIIPGSFAAENNPWGGTYSLSSTNGTSYTITLTGVPDWASQQFTSTYGRAGTVTYNGSTKVLSLIFF